jgi:hypothetical protein
MDMDGFTGRSTRIVSKSPRACAGVPHASGAADDAARRPNEPVDFGRAGSS